MYFQNTQCLYEEAQAAFTSFTLALEMFLLLKVRNCDRNLVSHTIHHDLISSDNSLTKCLSDLEKTFVI